MRVNRGLVFWGVALITAGVVALAFQSGTIGNEVARDAWRFWPVALIIIGLAIIAARSPLGVVATLLAGLVVGGLAGTLVGAWPGGINVGCGGEVDSEVTADGSFGSTAEVVLDFNCGELAVSTTPGGDWSVVAGYAGDAEPRITSTEDSLRVEAESDGVFVFGLDEGRQEWDVVLPTDPELDLTVNANAVDATVDLTDATLADLAVDANAGEVDLALAGATVETFELDANAGSMAITVDDATVLDGSVGMNAGSLDLCVPDGVALEITIDDPNVTFSHNLDEEGLTRQGDTWRGGDGTPAITLEVEGNAASFTLNPDGGCS